jgi:hypothetical protein
LAFGQWFSIYPRSTISDEGSRDACLMNPTVGVGSFFLRRDFLPNMNRLNLRVS